MVEVLLLMMLLLPLLLLLLLPPPPSASLTRCHLSSLLAGLPPSHDVT
jgi:hypothetical protein